MPTPTPVQDETKLRVHGSVVIRDAETNEILVEQTNAVHPENLSIAIARAMADLPTGHVQQMVFGNGASTVSATGEVTYFAPNVLGSGSQLYNQTYAKVVDDQSPLNIDPTKNYISVSHTANTIYSDIVVFCTLDFSEPAGQTAFDDASVTSLNSTDSNGNVIASTDASATYIFDEIGLKTYDASGDGDGLLLCHVIFHPLHKSLNRTLAITYTLRFVMA